MDKNLIEQNWNFKNVVMKDVLQNTDGRTTQRFISEGKEYVYKIAGSHKTADILQKELSVFDFLNEKQFAHISRLIKTNKNKLFATIQGHHIFVLEYVEGVKPQSNPENWKRLGIIAAELHTIQGYPFETDFVPNRIISNHFPEIALNLPFADEFLLLAQTLPDFSQLPKSLIHTDIGCHNAIETAQGNLVLIDWDDTGVGSSVLDIGFPFIVQFYTEEGDFFEENARAFYQSYFENRLMDEHEKGYIVDAGLFIAMHYIIYGNIEKRWQVIKRVFDNKERILEWIRSI